MENVCLPDKVNRSLFGDNIFEAVLCIDGVKETIHVADYRKKSLRWGWNILTFTAMPDKTIMAMMIGYGINKDTHILIGPLKNDFCYLLQVEKCVYHRNPDDLYNVELSVLAAVTNDEVEERLFEHNTEVSE